MRTFLISYLSNSGIVMLNSVEEAKSVSEAIEGIKNDTGVQMILSCIEITDNQTQRG